MVKWKTTPEEVGAFFPADSHLINKAMRVTKVTTGEIMVECDGETYGFTPYELELTSKLHEILE